jgi:hypothetical protein
MAGKNRVRGVIRGGLSAARKRLGRAADLVPLTPLGLAVGLLAGFTVRHYGREELDLVLLVASLFALALLGLAFVMVVVAAIVLKLRHRPRALAEGRELETGRFLPTGYRPLRLPFLPIVEVRHGWLTPSGVKVRTTRHAGRTIEEAFATSRGEHEGVLRRVVVRDVFGLAEVALRIPEATPTRVLPHRGALARMPILSSLARGEEHPHPMGLEDGDRVDLRRYAPGDPARFIHWKIFGRTRRLVVRVPERALAPAHRTAAYFVAGEDDEASAAAARAAIETGALGDDFRFGADGSPHPTALPSEAVKAVIRSAHHLGESAKGLEGFLAMVTREGPVSLLVFAPPRGGAWVARVADVARKRRMPVRVVVGVDGLAGGAPKPSLFARLVFRDPAPAGTSRPELERLKRELAAARIEAWVVDRVTGRVLIAGQRAVAGRVAA